MKDKIVSGCCKLKAYLIKGRFSFLKSKENNIFKYSASYTAR